MPSLRAESIKAWLQKANQAIWAYSRPFGDLFVECGTYTGDSTDVAKHLFANVHTIELSFALYSEAKQRFQSDCNVTCHHGNSVDVLSSLCPTFGRTPVVFWLDAHWSKGTTEFHVIHVPLLQELRTIAKECKGPCLIAVDDVRLFGSTEDGIDWSQVTEQAIVDVVSDRLMKKWFDSSELAENDRLILLLKEQI